MRVTTSYIPKQVLLFHQAGIWYNRVAVFGLYVCMLSVSWQRSLLCWRGVAAVWQFHLARFLPLTSVDTPRHLSDVSLAAWVADFRKNNFALSCIPGIRRNENTLIQSCFKSSTSALLSGSYSACQRCWNVVLKSVHTRITLQWFDYVLRNAVLSVHLWKCVYIVCNYVRRRRSGIG